MDWGDEFLRRMPLHAITQSLGLGGLRRRFQLEVARFDTAGRERLDRALRLAERLHEADKRANGEPYLGHVLRVAIRIVSADHYRVTDVDVLVAAVLHDSVEDHTEAIASDTTLDAQATAFGVLERHFGPRCSRLVRAVTNPPRVPGVDCHQQYRQHLESSLAEHPWARVIKASDLTDNATGVPYTTPAKARKSAVKYGPFLPVLRRLVMREDTPLAPEVKQHICAQIDLTQTRFAAILAGAK